jgi:hypothetical protein
VAEIQNPKNLEIAQAIGRDDVQLILTGDLIARAIVQICRQPGLSSVYTQLLSFQGNKIDFHSPSQLFDQTFGEAMFAYENLVVIGLCPRNGKPRLNHPQTRAFNQAITSLQSLETTRRSSCQLPRSQKSIKVLFKSPLVQR